MKGLYILFVCILAVSLSYSQSVKSTGDSSVTAKPATSRLPDTLKYAPDVLPGKGLAEHDFFMPVKEAWKICIS